jgi:glycine cleavage system H protein
MDIRFTADHEWLAIDGDIAKVGITDHAQSLLGELVFVELPGVGREVARGSTVATVESVKAASDVYAPLTGTIVEVNSRAADDPSLVNSDPMDAGWLFRIRFSQPSELSQLLTETDYQRLAQ